MQKGIRNRRMSMVKEIRLVEMMKLIPDDEFVIIFGDQAGAEGFREEDALYDGQAGDWWKECRTNLDMPRMRVIGILARELESVAGPVTMIVTDI